MRGFLHLIVIIVEKYERDRFFWAFDRIIEKNDRIIGVVVSF
jgi:hypothetical protein